MINESFIDNSTNILDLAKGLDVAAGGWFFGLLIVILTIFLLFTLSRFELPDNFIFTGILMSIITGILWATELVKPELLVLPVLLLMAGIFIRVINR